jgi:hypothetical protein
LVLSLILLDNTKSNIYPPLSELAEQWRNTTILRLLEKHPAEVPIVGAVTQRLISRIHTILKNEGPLSAASVASLKGIVQCACELSTMLGRQRCRLALFIPDGKIRYDHANNTEKLEPIGDSEIQFGEVAFAVVPGLRKWGNGYGKNLEVMDDIVGARVRVVQLAN